MTPEFCLTRCTSFSSENYDGQRGCYDQQQGAQVVRSGRPRSCSRANPSGADLAGAELVADGLKKRAGVVGIPASCAASQTVRDCSQSLSARRGTRSAGGAGWNMASSTDGKIKDFDKTKRVVVLSAKSSERKVEKGSLTGTPEVIHGRRQTGRTAQSVQKRHEEISDLLGCHRARVGHDLREPTLVICSRLRALTGDFSNSARLALGHRRRTHKCESCEHYNKSGNHVLGSGRFSGSDPLYSAYRKVDSRKVSSCSRLQGIYSPSLALSMGGSNIATCIASYNNTALTPARRPN